MDRPAALRELRYALSECEKKQKRLKALDVHSERKIVVLERVLEACD
jgi:hypothetical protein